VKVNEGVKIQLNPMGLHMLSNVDKSSPLPHGSKFIPEAEVHPKDQSFPQRPKFILWPEFTPGANVHLYGSKFAIMDQRPEIKIYPRGELMLEKVSSVPLVTLQTDGGQVRSIFTSGVNFPPAVAPNVATRAAKSANATVEMN
jgi:hypothetical protein